jgi:hypothetical protein
MAETQDEPDRGAHLQLLECIGLFGQLWPKADRAASSKWCLQNAERQSDNGSFCTNTGVLRVVGRLDHHLHRAWIPSYLGDDGVQPHSEKVWFAGGQKRSNQTLVSIGETEAAVPLDFPIAPMPSRERMSADAAYVTCVEVLDICSSFDPRAPR